MEINDFFNKLEHELPKASIFLKEHLEENYGELLPYVYLEQLTDELIALSDKDHDSLKIFLEITNDALTEASEDLKILIATSVSETIDSHVKDEKLHKMLLGLCGNKLRSTLIYL